MSTYFADLAANGDRHIFWLVLADKCRELRGQLIIQCLLFRDGWFIDVYRRGCIYIDIIKTGSDRFDRQKAYSLQFPLRVCGIFLRRDLEMIALYEHRAAKSLGHSSRKDVGRIFRWSLRCVCHFRTRKFKDERASIDLLRSAEHGTCRVIG